MQIKSAGRSSYLPPRARVRVYSAAALWQLRNVNLKSGSRARTRKAPAHVMQKLHLT